MMNKAAFTATLLFALVSRPAVVSSQTVSFRYKVTLPPDFVFRTLEDRQKSERVRLQWTYPHPSANGIRAGTTVQRSVRIGIDSVTESVTYPYTITSKDLGTAEPTPNYAPAEFAGAYASIYLDKANPGRILVRPFLRPGTHQYRINGVDSTLSGDVIREQDYFYDLKERMHVTFRFTAVSIGALTVPLRFRGAIRDTLGKSVPGIVSSQTPIGLYTGYTWGQASYHYVKGSDNKIGERRRLTFGTFATLAPADIDSTVTRASRTPVTRKTTMATVSYGLVSLVKVWEIEAGLFLGWDRGFGSSVAKHWDYQNRPWFGLGFGYQLYKLQPN